MFSTDAVETRQPPLMQTGLVGRLRHTLAEIRPLLLDHHGATVKIRTTAGELLIPEMVESAVATLRAAGISHGDRVIVQAHHDISSVAWFAAVWNLGATLIPVNGQMETAPLMAIAEDAQAAAICDPDSGELAKLTGKAPSRFQFIRPPRVTGVDLALIIYTSGSTGNPKGIMLTHANVMAALNAIVEYQRLSPEDRILCIPPLYFDYGLYQVLFGFHAGCEVLLSEPPVNPVKVVGLIKAHGPTVLPIVPAIGSGIAATMKAFGLAGDTVRLITNTGGHLPLQTIKGLQTAFPAAEVMPMYGLTESKRALFLPDFQVDQRPGSVGKPMPGLEAKVFIEEQKPDGTVLYREAAAHEVGQLFVRGASVMQGYSRGGNAGARIIPGHYRDDNWLATGDLFCTDEEGYFFYRGRDKDLIKQAGFCIYPRDIEAIVESHPGILAAAVVGAHDKSGDEIACLFIRMDAGTSAQTQSALGSWLRTKIDADYLPRRVLFIHEWPINANGKIDRNALKQLAV